MKLQSNGILSMKTFDEHLLNTKFYKKTQQSIIIVPLVKNRFIRISGNPG